jgi:hypothetical protein
VKPGGLWDIHLASESDAQRRRLDARAKPLRQLTPARTCVVVGGRGRLHELARTLAKLVGHAVVEIGPPSLTLQRILDASMGRPPRVVIIAPAREARPLLSEIRASSLLWPSPVDLLHGLRSRDREEFLRQAIRRAALR